eukprot:s12426_g1.t1
MRLLALGPQVYEIDLVGAHYEALRHITNALGLQPALLPVEISQCRGCSRRLVRPAIVVFGHG